MKKIFSPNSWEDIPRGVCYRQALEQSLKPWWSKIFGCHMLKIGALSADINTNDCVISHQVNVGLKGKYLQVIANPYKLPFANKSTDACLLAHTLSYISDPHRLLREVDRVLIDNGWIVITTFNPISMLVLSNLCPFVFRSQFLSSRMYTNMRLLTWLGVLNFEVLYKTYIQVWPFIGQGQFISTKLPAIGCLILIMARKRTFPINVVMELKNIDINRDLNYPVSTPSRTLPT